jgi:hypothetical protein
LAIRALANGLSPLEGPPEAGLLFLGDPSEGGSTSERRLLVRVLPNRHSITRAREFELAELRTFW